MRAKWTKLENGKSYLVLVFGHVSAEVINLGPSSDNPQATQWGILTHPYVPETLIGTELEAKARAEEILVGILVQAIGGLGYSATKS